MKRQRLKALAAAGALAALPVVAMTTPASANSCSISFSHASTYAQIYTGNTCGRYWRVKGSFADGKSILGSWRTTNGKYSVAYDANGGLREAWEQWKYSANGVVYSALEFG